MGMVLCVWLGGCGLSWGAGGERMGTCANKAQVSLGKDEGHWGAWLACT